MLANSAQVWEHLDNKQLRDIRHSSFCGAHLFQNNPNCAYGAECFVGWNLSQFSPADSMFQASGSTCWQVAVLA